MNSIIAGIVWRCFASSHLAVSISSETVYDDCGIFIIEFRFHHLCGTMQGRAIVWTEKQQDQDGIH
jgi:hypothetical protein